MYHSQNQSDVICETLSYQAVKIKKKQQHKLIKYCAKVNLKKQIKRLVLY